MKKTFIDRAQLFLDELIKNSFPNANSLALLCACSRNTAQRTIYRLRDEYLIPIDYDATEKGYYLLKEDFLLPSSLPATKGELLSLYIAHRVIDGFGFSDVTSNLESLWNKFTESNLLLRREVISNAHVLETEREKSIRMISDDFNVLPFIEASIKREPVSIHYTEKDEIREFHSVIIEKIRVRDTILSFILRKKDGTSLKISTNSVTNLSLSLQTHE